jgi:putative ABC transport system permease protein
MTVRACIGAGRLRLLRQLLTESLLRALSGGSLGLLLTGWGFRIFRALAPGWFPGIQATNADPRVILFTLAISVVTGLVFGLTPAISGSRVRLSEALTTVPRRRASVSGALVVGEVALAMVLLVGAGLMINTLRLASGHFRRHGSHHGRDRHLWSCVLQSERT